MAVNKQIRLRAIPSGIPKLEDFSFVDAKIPEIKEGEFLGKTIYLALDPYVRVTMTGRHFFNQEIVGDIPRGSTISKVVQSKNSDYKENDLVVMESGMQSYAVSDGTGVVRAITGNAPITTALGILGMPGLTAYSALMGPACLNSKDRIIVSAASGAVGSMVGQIASIKGAVAIGIAGSDEKCEWAISDAKMKSCLNRKKENLDKLIGEALPNGADIFFDNTGGDIQKLILSKHIAINSRIILSGLVSQYNSDTPPLGPNLGNICKQRATIFGFVVFDFEHMREAFLSDALQWYDQGLLNYKEDIVEGIESTPKHFIHLMKGNNFGKTIVQFDEL